MAGVGVAAGIAWFLGGLVVAYNGFAISTLGIALGGLSYLLLLLSLLVLAALMWRRAGKELAKPDARSPIIQKEPKARLIRPLDNDLQPSALLQLWR